MTNEKIKRMFDAFYLAKRIRDMLPPLPQGVMPSYIQYLDVIHSLQREKRISGSLISVMHEPAASGCHQNSERNAGKGISSEAYVSG